MQTPSFRFNLLEQEFLHFRIGGVRLALSSRGILATRKNILPPKGSELPTCCYFNGNQIPLVSADEIYHVGVRLQHPRDLILMKRGDRGIAMAVDEIEDTLSVIGPADIIIVGWVRHVSRGTPSGVIRRHKRDVLLVDCGDVVIH